MRYELTDREWTAIKARPRPKLAANYLACNLRQSGYGSALM